MNKRHKSLLFSFLGTILTLAAGSGVGVCMGRGPELVVIVTGLLITLIIGSLINKPGKGNDDSSALNSIAKDRRKK